MKISAKLVKELREKSSAGILDCKEALTKNNGDIEKSMQWLREKGIAKTNKKAGRIAAEGVVSITTNNKIAVIVEVNSETDFVAKNDKFLKLIELIGNTLLANSNIKTVEEALKINFGKSTLNDKIIECASIIGEKITLRRFKIIVLGKDESLGKYVHNNRSGTLLLFKGKISSTDGKQLAMHVTAMAPKFISRNSISKEYIENETQILTKKALSEGKPKNIVEKMVKGRLNKALAEISFLDQSFVIDPEIKVGKYIKDRNIELLEMIRYEVGEGIEKNQDDFATEVMKQVKK